MYVDLQRSHKSKIQIQKELDNLKIKFISKT